MRPARSLEAIALLEEGGQTIDLWLTDVIMPEISERVVADVCKTLRPHGAVFFMSDDVAPAILATVTYQDTLRQRPFSEKELLAIVHSIPGSA